VQANIRVSESTSCEKFPCDGKEKKSYGNSNRVSRFCGCDCKHFGAFLSNLVFLNISGAAEKRSRPQAEKVLAFEHRDLHWGNVLLKPCDAQEQSYQHGGDTFTVQTHGVHASIIDFTLSRLERGGKVFFFDLETDECYFDGEGDMQFDCYRSMRKSVKKKWGPHQPKTNLYWIQYLIDKILNDKPYHVAPTQAGGLSVSLRPSFLRSRGCSLI
jgi:hypothetical protein